MTGPFSPADERWLSTIGSARLAPGPGLLDRAVPVGLHSRDVGPGLGGHDLGEHLATYGPRPNATGSGGRDLLAALERVSLSGRGGAHFPAARKWHAAIGAGGGGLVVANCAEGEPASAKDAALLQLRPHLVLDGLELAAPAGQVTALVLLRAQADVGSIRANNRRDRLAKVEQALRSTASQDQRALLNLLRTRRAEHQVTSYQPMWLANEVLVTGTPTVLAELAARADVGSVLPERTLRAPEPSSGAGPALAQAEQGIDRVDAPAMWGQGFVGQGVVVASLDTGVDVTHPDLQGRWRGGTNSWFDPYGQHPTTPTDINGHGTQTMGVIVGGSAGGTAIGVAPNASWIAAKIFDDRGVATTTAIHEAFQWVLDPDGDPATVDAPAIVNNSWDDQTTSCSAEFQPDLAALRAAGILPVFAAGNDGPMDGSVLNPANLPEALSVGGTDDSDVIEPSSSRGPSSCGQPVSPNLTAPDTAVRTTDLYGGYVTATGTSLAAPHVSGALALLLSASPNLTAEQLQSALTAGAVDLGRAGPDQTYGAGRLDALTAYQSVSPTPDFTVSVAPTSVTVTPGGTASYTVSVGPAGGFTGDVSLSLTGLDGTQATPTFSPDVVPSGSGSAALSVTTSTALPPGNYPLTVTGTSGAISHSATTSVVVAPPPDFTLGAAPSAVSVTAGSSVGVTLTIGALNGFAGVVNLSADVLPANIGSVAVQPNSIAGSGTAQLTFSTLATAAAGTYPLTVSATSGQVTHTVALSLTVSAAAPDFTVTVTPPTVTVKRGNAATYTVSVAALGGFTGKVKLTRTGVPPGASTNWTTKTVAAPKSVALKLKTTSATPRGTYQVLVTGGCGLQTHQVTVTLVVT